MVLWRLLEAAVSSSRWAVLVVATDTLGLLAATGAAGNCVAPIEVMTAGPPPPDPEDPVLPAEPVLKRLAGQPYLLLLRCRSMSHRRLNAFPQDGQRWVPRCMCRWC